jgi:hypothetical protein
MVQRVRKGCSWGLQSSKGCETLFYALLLGRSLSGCSQQWSALGPIHLAFSMQVSDAYLLSGNCNNFSYHIHHMCDIRNDHLHIHSYLGMSQWNIMLEFQQALQHLRSTNWQLFTCPFFLITLQLKWKKNRYIYILGCLFLEFND